MFPNYGELLGNDIWRIADEVDGTGCSVSGVSHVDCSDKFIRILNRIKVFVGF
jgi:hypothetical protein